MQTNTTVKAAEERMARDLISRNRELEAIIADRMRRDAERDKRYFADIEVRRGRRVVFVSCT